MAIETHNRVSYQTDPIHQEERELHEDVVPKESLSRESLRKATVGGAGFAGVAGLAAAVLSILGLVDIVPTYMAGIATIVVGVALLIAGGFTAAWLTGERFAESSEMSYSAELIGGIAGIVLGILSLVGFNAQMLVPIAVLALGTSTFLSSWTGGVGGGKTFIGLSSAILGILGLVGYVPMTLSLVGLLCLGSAAFLGGAGFSVKLMSSSHS